jgi:ankyrin repeat protein
VDLTVRDGDGKTPLARAVHKDHFGCVAALVVAGVDPNQDFGSGWTALHAASERGSHVVVQLLLNSHAMVNATTANGTTPLMVAATEDVVASLLQHGAPSATCHIEDVLALHETW